MNCFLSVRTGIRCRPTVAGVVCIPEVGLRHREPQSREKLKALVARVRRDFGPLVQNAGQAYGKDGSDPFAPLLARKIRERLIRHGISHRVGRNTSWDSLSSPELCMPLGRKWARKFESENNADECGPAFRGRGVGRVPGNGRPYPI